MATKNALIYGGSGALGSVLVSFFRQRNWSVLSVDSRANASASDSVILNLQLSWKEQEQQVLSNVAEKLGGKKLDVVICVAGGWAGGNAADDKLVDASELMWKQSVQSSAIAARLSTKYLNDGGLLVLTGARAALQGTAGMIGYGMAKAAVHQLAQSLSSPGSGMPNGSKVVCILPVTLDTPGNRAAMPKADTSSWTPLETLAEKMHEWALNPNAVPSTLVEVVTAGSKTLFQPAK